MDWMSPSVIVPNNNVKICIRIDYRRLNKATVHDNYLVSYPNIYQREQRGRQTIVLSTDSLNMYNQISIVPKDQHNIAFFAIEFGIFVYQHMSFGLTHTSPLSTYQGMRGILHHCIQPSQMVLNPMSMTCVATPRTKNTSNYYTRCSRNARSSNSHLNPSSAKFGSNTDLSLGQCGIERW